MFYRISSKSQGSGIGLYIVKDTVAKLREIQVHSKLIRVPLLYHVKKFKICRTKIKVSKGDAY
jgi:hypothetical protein